MPCSSRLAMAIRFDALALLFGLRGFPRLRDPEGFASVALGSWPLRSLGAEDPLELLDPSLLRRRFLFLSFFLSEVSVDRPLMLTILLFTQACCALIVNPTSRPSNGDGQGLGGTAPRGSLESSGWSMLSSGDAYA